LGGIAATRVSMPEAFARHVLEFLDTVPAAADS
jgi:hypothetical protein